VQDFLQTGCPTCHQTDIKAQKERWHHDTKWQMCQI